MGDNNATPSPTSEVQVPKPTEENRAGDMFPIGLEREATLTSVNVAEEPKTPTKEGVGTAGKRAPVTPEDDVPVKKVKLCEAEDTPAVSEAQVSPPLLAPCPPAAENSNATQPMVQSTAGVNDTSNQHTIFQRNGVSGFHPGGQPGGQFGMHPGGQPGIQPGMQPGVYPGIQPGIQPGQPGGHPGRQFGMHPGVHPGTQPGMQPGMYPAVHPGVYHGAQPAIQPGACHGFQPGVQYSIQPGHRFGFQPGVQPGVQPVQPVQPGVQPGFQPGAQPGFQPGSQPGVQPVAQPGVQPRVQPGYLSEVRDWKWNPDLYTRRFISDLATTLCRSFQMQKFAEDHHCSMRDVFVAVNALVIFPLSRPQLKWSKEEHVNITDWAQMMMCKFQDYCTTNLLGGTKAKPKALPGFPGNGNPGEANKPATHGQIPEVSQTHPQTIIAPTNQVVSPNAIPVETVQFRTSGVVRQHVHEDPALRTYIPENMDCEGLQAQLQAEVEELERQWRKKTK